MAYFSTGGNWCVPAVQNVNFTASGIASEADLKTVRDRQATTDASIVSLTAEQKKLQVATKAITDSMLDNPAMKMLASLGEEMSADKAKVKSLTIEVESLTAQLTNAKLRLAEREVELESQLKGLQEELEEKNRAIDSVLLSANEFVSAVAATVPRATAAATPLQKAPPIAATDHTVTSIDTTSTRC